MLADIAALDLGIWFSSLLPDGPSGAIPMGAVGKALDTASRMAMGRKYQVGREGPP